MDDYECDPMTSRNLNELMGKNSTPKATDSSSHITKGMESLNVNPQENAVPENPCEGATGRATNTNTPSKGSQSAKKKESQSGKTNTPNQRFVSLRQLCTSPDSQSIDTVKRDLFKEDRDLDDKNKEKNMAGRMKSIPDKLLLRTGKVLKNINFFILMNICG